jgi:glutaredoxin
MAKPPRITLYSTANCAYCKQAREFLRSRNIAHQELDIQRSERARKQFERLGARGVPVIMVGDAQLNGFKANTLLKLLREAGVRV